MREAPAYEFAPHQVGYDELESIKLSKRIDHFEANAALRQEIARRDRLMLTMAIVALIPIVGLAAFVGLGRLERAIQLEARV